MSSITVTFINPDTEEELSPEPYELQVKSFCTDETVAGVTVYMDGTEMGQTDADGVISLGALLPGSTHTLKMVKDGYISSDQDKLNNDSFTVPAS